MAFNSLFCFPRENVKLSFLYCDKSFSRVKVLPIDRNIGVGKPLGPPIFDSIVFSDTIPTNMRETDATLALFFPDAGSAALAKFEWGAGTEAAQVKCSMIISINFLA